MTVNVVITVLGSGGDVFPFIALGQVLRERGHTVALLANPHFAAAVAAADLPLVPLGTEEEYLVVLREPDFWHPRRGFPVLWRLLVEQTPRVLAAIEEQIVPGQTVLVGSTLSLAIRLAQERGGIPAAMVHLSPNCFLSAHAFPVTALGALPEWAPLWARRVLLVAMDRIALDATCVPSLNALRATLGLPPVRSVMRRWLHSPDLTVGAFPAWFAAPQPDWPPATVVTGFPRLRVRADPTLLEAVQEFLAAGPPPVVVTAGTAMAQGHAFFARALQAVAALGQRALFVTRFADQLPERLPDSVRVAAHLPFDVLLPQVAVLVHHGGIGTTAAALAAGIPQLVIPFAFDQFDNAARVVRLGVGRSCPTLDAAAWTAGLGALLAPDDARRDALRRCQTLLAEAPDASVQIAEHLENLVSASSSKSQSP